MIARIVATWTRRRRLAGVLHAAGLAGLLAGCGGMPQGPTYTDAELRAICERQGAGGAAS